MNELTELRRMRTLLAEPDPHRTAAIRTRVTDGMEGSARPVARGPRRYRAVVIAGGLTVATAAAATIALIAGGRHAGPLGTPDAAAAELLNRAAVVAEARPGIHPRPRQYVHLEFTGRELELPENNKGLEAPVYVTVHDRWWERADGKGATLLRRQKGNPTPLRPGLPLPAHLPYMDNGDELTQTECGESGPVAQDYAWVASLPTDPVRLRRALRSSLLPERDDSPEMRWQVITDALHRGVTSPKLLAALFRLAAEIPGARVIPNLRDDLGRPATAIQYLTRLDAADAPQTEQLILDAKSLRYLGSRTVVGEPRAGLARGTVLYSSMLVKLDVTDKLPKLERGTRLARC